MTRPSLEEGVTSIMGRARSYALITVVFVAFGVTLASGKTSRPPDAWLTTKAKIAAAAAEAQKVSGVKRVVDELQINTAGSEEAGRIARRGA